MSGTVLEKTWAPNSCEALDSLPAEYRKLAHEYGLSVIRAFLQCGVKKPNQISHLIHTVHLGPREYSNQPVRGSNSKMLQQIDDFLVRSGAGPVGRMFIRELWQSNTVVLPMDGTNVGKCLRQLSEETWPWL
jgi:hypothetical protein